MQPIKQPINGVFNNNMRIKSIEEEAKHRRNHTIIEAIQADTSWASAGCEEIEFELEEDTDRAEDGSK